MNMLYKPNFITVHFAVINNLKWFVAGMDGVEFLSQGGAGQGQKSTGQGIHPWQLMVAYWQLDIDDLRIITWYYFKGEFYKKALNP